MIYLTPSEYIKFGFTEITDETLFYKLSMRASGVLDNITRNFYRRNDLESDVKWRKWPFKKTVGCQIEYFFEMEQVTSTGMNATPQSMTVGRTTISMGSRNSSKGVVEKPLLCPDVYVFLEGTGLLNRGVS